MGGLGDHHHAALEQEPQSGLGSGFSVLCPDCCQGGIGKKILAPFGKGAPAFVLDLVFQHILMGLFLLLEHMGFHLVHRRGDLHESAQVNKPVRIKIGNANSPKVAYLIGLLHRPPGAVVVAKGLMDEQQVDIIGSQLLERLLNRCLCLFVTGIGNPNLGGEKQLAAGNAAFLQGPAHRFLVAIGLGGINGAVSHLYGIQNAPFAFAVFYLIDPIAQLGHFYAVIQCDKIHIIPPLF